MAGASDRTEIQAIRHFNRYYTNRIGLLSRYRFNTRLTLTEARVLFEVGRRGEHTQSGLCTDLKIDKGYLNRIVKRLAGRGFLDTRTNPADSRVLLIELARAGRGMLAEMDAASDVQAEELLDGLDDGEARSLVRHLKEVETILERKAGQHPRIERAEGSADIATARALMREYAAQLGVDLSFQGFEAELSHLPGKYAPPSGALYLAWVPSRKGRPQPAGCVALRRLEPGVCEMKRLFVRPEYRGMGIGRLLAERIIEEARGLGYSAMRLDTLATLESAVALYRSLGFKPIPPYCDNPLPGAMFWEMKLATAPAPGKRGRKAR